jgi:hypothetical protein
MGEDVLPLYNPTHGGYFPRAKPVWLLLIIWTGQAFPLMGSQLVQFALVWWLTVCTGSATVLSLATLAALLP